MAGSSGKPPVKDYFDRNKGTANENGKSDYSGIGTPEWHAAKRAREFPEPDLPPKIIRLDDEPATKPAW